MLKIKTFSLSNFCYTILSVNLKRIIPMHHINCLKYIYMTNACLYFVDIQQISESFPIVVYIAFL